MRNNDFDLHERIPTILDKIKISFEKESESLRFLDE
jgi:hypothetical protein